ncbi:MAG: hypothetical protein IPK68_22640 [Bdellovibrionales bacterium]|nr:hypothetical protein [Bdellovibrionales bacterium]
MYQNTSTKNHQIIETINFYRGLILDLVEVEMAETQNWPAVRSRLLRLLGDKGLEGRVRVILLSPKTGEAR